MAGFQLILDQTILHSCSHVFCYVDLNLKCLTCVFSHPRSRSSYCQVSLSGPAVMLVTIVVMVCVVDSAEGDNGTEKTVILFVIVVLKNILTRGAVSQKILSFTL